MKNNRWECPSKEFAIRFAERLKMDGYIVLKIAKHWGRWFVTVKNEEVDILSRMNPCDSWL